MRQNVNPNSEPVNYALLLPVFLLIVVGFIAQYGAFYADPSVESITPLMIKQLLWTILGIVAMFITMFIPIKYLWKFTPTLYGLSLLLMSLLIKFHDPVMAAATGTKRWIRLGPLSFQPSEFMKLGYILMLAYVVTRRRQKASNPSTLKEDFRLLGELSLVSLPVFALMFYQKDFGTSLVFISIFLGVVLVSGCSWKILTVGFGILGVIGVSGILLVLTERGQAILSYLHFQPYQFNRIHAWLNPFEYADSISFQQARGLTAIGSGEMLGKGLTDLQIYVPVRESDMIFTVIGEAYGFIGTCTLILLFFYLIYQMLICTLNAKREFYAYITTGVIMYFLFHILENIGSNIGLLPLTGIPLPFISQGGTAYLANFIGVGLILSMYYQKEKN
ncbi:rod shape-determining protein RodA [Enterococcus plantarum]|uniref:FtsW/RodA/SpoVE family cell cycle protein n=1 Tax=Enterococcus plantarum TaxID=1077675 RepID=UPI00084D8545|nr:FtsW/RodA/SpoVE family cell cycle protein [Enterococcus plantarum]MBO0421402.1 FtsW/RodA/SpoVE family cell cycle protein [Enterococcus plantarum]MBO0467553.1 FtsW/RodA/SpoVE family cell cycle protein [Enterococcus plantarum]OEG20834.1 rod shape-determining protein RodA [Enterococcus plantarum]